MIALAASLLGWLIYSSLQRPARELSARGAVRSFTANTIAAFSFRQVGAFVLILALTLGLFTLVLSGYFNGRRRRTGALLMGLCW